MSNDNIQMYPTIIFRIIRVIRQKGGHALLVGMGGSGRWYAHIMMKYPSACNVFAYFAFTQNRAERQKGAKWGVRYLPLKIVLLPQSFGPHHHHDDHNNADNDDGILWDTKITSLCASQAELYEARHLHRQLRALPNWSKAWNLHKRSSYLIFIRSTRHTLLMTGRMTSRRQVTSFNTEKNNPFA